MINFAQQFNVLEVIFATKPPGLGLKFVSPLMKTVGQPAISHTERERLRGRKLAILSVLKRVCTVKKG